MIARTTERQDLTLYSQLVLDVLLLPLLFIAGVQLFILSEQTETYFAWTFGAPVSAAFLGAGYWAAMFHAYTGARSKSWVDVYGLFLLLGAVVTGANLVACRK